MSPSGLFALFFESPIYHLVLLGDSRGGGDATMCGIPTMSRKGRRFWDTYRGGRPTPQVISQLPEGKRLCKACEKQRAREMKAIQRTGRPVAITPELAAGCPHRKSEDHG
jgi:hypothetical protein